jgi:hypothetical protein
MAAGMQDTAVDDQQSVSLIASAKVEGTAVYDAEGKRIGKIERPPDIDYVRQAACFASSTCSFAPSVRYPKPGGNEVLRRQALT